MSKSKRAAVLATAQEMIRAANAALRDPDGVLAPGMCWRFQRLGIVEALGLPTPGAGLDAKQAGRWYRTAGYSVQHDGWENTLPGDLIFWLDGAHGHVAIRVLGNRVAENSSVHSHAGSDARGHRSINDLRPPAIVVRLWR